MSTKRIGVLAILLLVVTHPLSALAQSQSALADIRNVPLTMSEMESIEGRLAPVVAVVGGAIAGAAGEYAATGKVSWAGVLSGALGGAGGAVGAALFGVKTISGGTMSVLYMANGAALGSLTGKGLDEALEDIEEEGQSGTSMSVGMSSFDPFGDDEGVPLSCLVFGCVGMSAGYTLTQSQVDAYAASGFTRALGVATYTFTANANCASCGTINVLR